MFHEVFSQNKVESATTIMLNPNWKGPFCQLERNWTTGYWIKFVLFNSSNYISETNSMILAHIYLTNLNSFEQFKLMKRSTVPKNKMADIGRGHSHFCVHLKTDPTRLLGLYIFRSLAWKTTYKGRFVIIVKKRLNLWIGWSRFLLKVVNKHWW